MRRTVVVTLTLAVIAASGGGVLAARWLHGSTPRASLRRTSQRDRGDTTIVGPARTRPMLRAHPGRRPAPGGTRRWRLSRPATDHQIEGYALATSVKPGQPVVLRVSTTASRYRVMAYRFGWYRGGQARMVWRSRSLPGSKQRPPTFANVARRTVVAPWQNSLTVSTARWRPGDYVFKLAASSGWQSYIPLVVRSTSVAGKVVLVAPVATWQAYNSWGDYSLYTGPPGAQRSFAVSYDRPYGRRGHGAGSMFYGVRPVVVEAERLGVPVAYTTDLQLSAHRNALAGARAYVSMGHDEYWTVSMRRTVLRARAHGTNLVFLGADTEFWRIRLARSRVGPRRVQIGYRWSYRQDPLYARRSVRNSGPFSFPPKPRPEKALTGTEYECFPVDAPYTVTSPRWWGFSGTGVHRGEKFGHLVGIEADRVYPGPSTPRPIQILSSSRYSCLGKKTSAQSVYYTTASGAGVFNAGTLRWTCALLYRACGPGDVSARTVRFVRRVTANVLRAFAAGPAGTAHPAHGNVAHYRLPTSRTVPTD